MDLQLLKVISVFETSEILVKNGPLYRFRIEVLLNLKTMQFLPRVYRLELMRLQPTFPQSGGEPILEESDEEIWVRDLVLVEENFSTNSEESCLNYIQQKLIEAFGKPKNSEAE